MATKPEKKHEYILADMEEYEFDTVLEEDINFSGFLAFKKPFLIKGRVSGEIKAEGPLLIAESAHIEANITSPKILVRGYVKGHLAAEERVDVTASGTVIGNITSPQIYMESGCTFNGNCTMAKPTGSRY